MKNFLPHRFLNSFPRRDKILGVATETRRYDLPLAGNTGNSFLRLLIGLMSLLGILALCASFALAAMTERWSSGLAGKISIEVPATDSAGEVIAPGIVGSMTQEALAVLMNHEAVEDAAAMGEEQVRALLAPWLGTDLVMDSIPVPGLISVTLKKDAAPDLDELQLLIRDVAPQARIDTHESWLADVVRFTSALQFAAILLTVIIGATTLVAVAGGVRSKLSESKEELELLHLMGASDSYIARQIQRHTLILALQGGAFGVAAGFVLLFVISLIAGEIGANLIPDFSLSAAQKTALFLMPLPIALLATGTARYTVLRVLGKMP